MTARTMPSAAPASGNVPFAMQLASPNWRLDAGTLGTTMSDLTGVNLIGRGAYLHITTPLLVGHRR